MECIEFIDATLRDGNHALKQQLSCEDVKRYCAKIDDAGMDAVIVGHGNGLGASSLQVGLALENDRDLLSTAKKNLKKTRLGAYLIPGFGTIKDNIDPAIECGIELLKVGCHCTEADTTRQHIEYAKFMNLQAYGILMMYHMTSTDKLIEEAKKMQSYGADAVIIMDSAGASTPEMVKRTVAGLKNNLDIKIGFHAHNNMSMAVANTYVAIQEGATVVDGTLRGLGAGAGNCQLEAIAALLKKEGYKTKLDLYKLFDVSKEIVAPLMNPANSGLDDISIVSGMSGVFSAFKVHVINAAKTFDVDARDILMELGRQRVIAGQEDKIVEIAQRLKKEDL
mgnify:CR=1 FL=1